jgi:hypothetical protein
MVHGYERLYRALAGLPHPTVTPETQPQPDPHPVTMVGGRA